MIYELIPFHEAAEEIARNVETHYADMDLKEDYGRPDVDWDMYLQLSLAGRCVAVIARVDGEMVAYAGFLLSNNLHYKKFIEATNTGIFIKKPYRSKITLEFIKKCDEFLEEMGVVETLYAFSDKRLGRLLERAKYKARQTIWSNRYVTFSNTIIGSGGK